LPAIITGKLWRAAGIVIWLRARAENASPPRSDSQMLHSPNTRTAAGSLHLPGMTATRPDRNAAAAALRFGDGYRDFDHALLKLRLRLLSAGAIAHPARWSASRLLERSDAVVGLVAQRCSDFRLSLPQ
jgi:hypothetical protein